MVIGGLLETWVFDGQPLGFGRTMNPTGRGFLWGSSINPERELHQCESIPSQVAPNRNTNFALNYILFPAGSKHRCTGFQFSHFCLTREPGIGSGPLDFAMQRAAIGSVYIQSILKVHKIATKSWTWQSLLAWFRESRTVPHESDSDSKPGWPGRAIQAAAPSQVVRAERTS